MPDFEIRYFHADGSLALVHVTAAPTDEDALKHARLHQQHYNRFEVRRADGSTLDAL
ncbi:MAG: hypothetical protein ACREHE_14650 [Rhizomicrobium sp.]